MKRALSLLAFALLGLGAGPTQPAPLPPAPPSGPSPLLYVRLLGPTGSRLTVYQGGPAGVELESPLALAVRPGYIYRVKLSELPHRPGVALYPTLEVRGTLHLPPGMEAAKHPTPVIFSEVDIERVLAGSFITKVIALEHPDRAAPVATVADQPLETELRPHEDMLAHARILGRPMLILRLGGRTTQPDDSEIAGIPNTMLLPGCQSLGQPPLPPQLPWSCHSLYDPILGPRPPEEECLHDGGDGGRAVGLDRTGKLFGLDPADTVAEYTTNKGQRQLAVSNRVCVCVPRFAVLRQVLTPTGYEAVHSLDMRGGIDGSAIARARTPSVEAIQREHVVLTTGRERPSIALQRMGPALYDQVTGTTTVIAQREGQVVVGILTKEPCETPAPLQLLKWADKHTAQIGDVVTFHIRYTNPGSTPINDVVVSDSLTARLEYVAGTAASDRQATFTTQANEAGSLILRWEVGGKLMPGQSGLVSFQARIR